MNMATHIEDNSRCKIVSWRALLIWRERARLERRSVVWTNGCFDLLHVGHIRTLQAARTFGDALVVGLNSDASVRALKGPSRPMVPALERAEILAALACVDFVTIFDNLTPQSAIAELQPDVCCKGDDYRPPDGKPMPEAETIVAYGGRIEFISLTEGHSTSAIIERAGLFAPIAGPTLPQ